MFTNNIRLVCLFTFCSVQLEAEINKLVRALTK